MSSSARDRMVDAGVELFGERGYANVSLLEVIERANAPRGSIYYHFPGGKEELGVEVSARLRHSVERDVVRLVARADSAEAFLRAFVDLHRKRLAATDFGQGCTMAGILANIGAEGPDPLRVSVGDTISAWIEAITNGLVTLGVEPAKAKLVASNVVAAIEGATIISRATRSMASFAQIKVMLGALLSFDLADAAA
jgi:TetR/AcrR family transcriptional repressor of lmrAB and yxaGH operons